jgi:hypothetical protein
MCVCVCVCVKKREIMGTRVRKKVKEFYVDVCVNVCVSKCVCVNLNERMDE